jgi:hypothetical protein
MNLNLNKHFRKDYDRLFREDPLMANMFLLLVELADKNGQIIFEGNSKKASKALRDLLLARFNDPLEYALRKEGKSVGD